MAAPNYSFHGIFNMMEENLVKVYGIAQVYSSPDAYQPI